MHVPEGLIVLYRHRCLRHSRYYFQCCYYYHSRYYRFLSQRNISKWLLFMCFWFWILCRLLLLLLPHPPSHPLRAIRNPHVIFKTGFFTHFVEAKSSAATHMTDISHKWDYFRYMCRMIIPTIWDVFWDQTEIMRTFVRPSNTLSQNNRKPKTCFCGSILQ